jgi:acetyl esterase
MPVDPQVRILLDEAAALNLPPRSTLSVAQARADAIAANVDPGVPAEPVARVENRIIPGPAGMIPIRVYASGESGPFPVLVYFHGSGFVLNNLDTHDGICRSLTNSAGCLTVSVDYRLAPEHPFPAAVEDSFAATTWVAAHAAELGGDPNRIAVGGDSAGGNLAAVVTHLARDKGAPHLAFQLLIYPVADRPGTTLSYQESAEGYGLTLDDMAWFWNHYMPDKALECDPRAAPLREADLHGLPPAMVVTAEYDPLRDEAEIYAQMLADAGIQVQLVRYDGMIHGFFHYARCVERARQALDETGASLRRALGA